MKNKRDLNFICAYADVYDMMNRPFVEVYDELCEIFDNLPCTPDDYIESFMEKYSAMNEYGLYIEIKFQITVLGDSFFEACAEWDI